MSETSACRASPNPGPTKSQEEGDVKGTWPSSGWGGQTDSSLLGRLGTDAKQHEDVHFLWPRRILPSQIYLKKS
jgi:hypothetical protein